MSAASGARVEGPLPGTDGGAGQASAAAGVTVVIPTYNHAHYLEECLKSLQQQSYPHWRAIVVDDFSSDHRALAPVLERLGDERISFVRHERNRGLAASRNTGIRAADTPYVFPLDADDLLAPQALELLVGALEADPGLDCAYGDVVMFGRARGTLVFPGPRPGRNVTSPRDTIPGAGTMMRKTLWTRMGGYDEADALRHGREDFEFWIRAFNQGCRSKRVSVPLYHYRHSHTSMNTACRREDHTVSQYIHDKHRAVFDSPEHAREFLGAGYLSASEASYQKGEHWRSLRLAAQALRIDPGGQALRQLAKAFVPQRVLNAHRRGELRRWLPLVRYPMRGAQRYRPFFVIGVARSGNTLFRRVLTAHSKLHIPPETFVLGEVHRLFRRYRGKLTWPELVRMVLASFEFHPEYHTIDVWLGPLAARLAALPSKQRNLAALIDGFYRFHAEHSGRHPDRWGDKTPLNSLYRSTLAALVELFPDAQFLHIYRDPADVIYSHLSGGFMRTVEEASYRWLTVMRNVGDFAARHPAACYALRYEDLVGNPEPTVRGVCEFLGVDFEPQMLSSEKVAKQLGDVPAWFWHQNVNRPIEARHAGKGRSLFSKQQLASMRAIIGPEMAKLDYPPIEV
jgi:glycosyltransferase involved in cell wall biosynthesis